MSFEPVPRRDAADRPRHDLANLQDELRRIERRLEERVVGGDRAVFLDGSDSYDAASMAVVRLHGVLERREYAFLLDAVSDTEMRAISTIRNTVSHGGYRSMDDESFWETATLQLPDLVLRLIARADAEPGASGR
ncbi:antitoxin [Arenivirga flava]|uniref:Uncharacterized protein n=1 Tax=Arenivirga flava TaxID=1930060 RepID=A0AA37XBA7_9MICO|nr:antitoxin [Arenivirga flava]GMA27392.1 hypothetical protein GCM10025874_06450 [Arenivirga flava]